MNFDTEISPKTLATKFNILKASHTEQVEFVFRSQR